MKFLLTSLALLSAFVAAQDLSTFPECSRPCLQKGIDASGCDKTDTKCVCTTGYQKSQEAVIQCIVASNPCSPEDQDKIQTASDEQCAQYKGGSAPASGSASASASSAVSSASSGASSAAGSATSAASSAASSAAASASSAAAGSGASGLQVGGSLAFAMGLLGMVAV